MGIEEFLSTIDALRFDASLDETNPELRGLVQKYYPVIRRIYNEMSESGLIAEAHGMKKRNSPKDTLAAMRKGNRDAERDIYGDGFRANKKIHKSPKMYDRKISGKIDISNLDKYVDEAIKRVAKETIKESITNLKKSLNK